MDTEEILLTLSTIFSALMSGFFFAYTFSVNLGLRQLDDRSYLMAMQQINRRVLNPIFFLIFLGTPLLLIALSVSTFSIQSIKSNLIVFATAVYVVGVFIITATRNVPLNNQLEELKIESSAPATLNQARAGFENTWVFWNNLRTLAAFVTIVCLVYSIIFL